MGVILSTCIVLYSLFFNADVYKYEVECGATGQWVNGKKLCSVFNNSVFLSLSSETPYKSYTVFQLKTQNIGSDTLVLNPADIYVIRVYTDGRIDSVQIVNPEVLIQQAKTKITYSENEITHIIKAQNTQNATIDIVRSIPKANKVSTNTSISDAVYQQKLHAAQVQLQEATDSKYFWETQALRANTIYPLNYVENKVYFETNNCMKAIIHVKLNGSFYEFLILQEKM